MSNPLEILGIKNQRHVPIKHKKGFWLPLDEKLAFIEIYDVEQTPKNPSYCYSKKIIYCEKNTFLPMGLSSYDRKGELWKFFFGSIKTQITSDGQKSYNTGVNCAIDVQITHFTTTDIMDYPVNVGLTPGDFSLSNITTVSRMGGL